MTEKNKNTSDIVDEIIKGVTGKAKKDATAAKKGDMPQEAIDSFERTAVLAALITIAAQNNTILKTQHHIEDYLESVSQAANAVCAAQESCASGRTWKIKDTPTPPPDVVTGSILDVIELLKEHGLVLTDECSLSAIKADIAKFLGL
jgi:hypothetical protein